MINLISNTGSNDGRQYEAETETNITETLNTRREAVRVPKEFCDMQYEQLEQYWAIAAYSPGNVVNMR